MREALGAYLQELGQRWNQFWFTPREPHVTCLLRWLVGASACWYWWTFAGHLREWFGTDGLLPSGVARQLGGGPEAFQRWSYLHAFDSPALLSLAHAAALVVLLAFTTGLLTRISSVLSLVIVLAYVHRAPMIAGTWEPVLTMCLLYLCIAPCGAVWSLDRWWQDRRSRSGSAALPEVRAAVSANLAIRLLQVHVSALYLMMGLTKLAGETWWSGDAVWWLIARTQAPLVDLRGLHSSTLLINFWTHGLVVYELAFSVLIWTRLGRPVLLLASGIVWGSVAVLTGQLGFCVLMVLVNVCFLPPRLVSGLHQRNG